MMDFQTEPESVKQPMRCERCHEVLITPLRVTSEKDPYCLRCGHVLGTSVQPATWACEECGEIILDVQPDTTAPWCRDCDIPMSCLQAAASRIHGTGTGDDDLEFGLAFLVEAQAADLELGSDSQN